MIVLTRLNGRQVVLNAELIETVLATPDTVIALTTGKKLLVQESVAIVTDRVEAYLRRMHGQVAYT